ncbi:MAG TPA: YigZ family protein [Firmicutes bacterium]|nr:YigZ family protein [Bacillota bacterium]
MDTYRTVAQETEVEIKIERSRFIGQVRPVNSEQEAKDFIARISELHRQATHNCWAYRVDPERDTRFSSDDGEPTGTAGEPILRAILSQELTNTVVVVTRYFGGKKLGIRGLIEAYGGTATQVLAAAGTVQKIITETFQLNLDYPQLDQCQYCVHKYNGQIVNADYQQQVTLQVAIPRSKTKSFLGEIRNLAHVKTD